VFIPTVATKSPFKSTLLILLFLAVGYASYLLTVNLAPKKQPSPPKELTYTRSVNFTSPKRSIPSLDPRKPVAAIDREALENGALRNQRTIVFKDEAALQAFLAKLGDKVKVLGKIDKLNTLLVGFGDLNDLDSLLNGDEELSMIYPVNIPSFENVGPQDGAVALENNLLKWLGVESDNSLWGKGITIAILDTGIADHIAFKNAIQRINIVPLPSDPSSLNGHGTAVASVIFSDNPLAPGVAPAATPLSVRIANDDGTSNSFLIAQGIIAAVDAGADIINISLGGSGQSSLVDQAIAYAKKTGAVIIAASGNSGTEGVMQPAASPGVIAVGAVDANNQSMNFSTTGNEVAISSPGFGVNVAYPGNKAAQVSGTSFSSPIVAGVFAAVASSSGKPGMSAEQAAHLVMSNLNDVGVAGTDPSTGAGVPDMGTIMNLGTNGRHDASINSIYQTNGNQLNILVQNLGSETLINSAVSININGGSTQANITTLAPMQTHVITIPHLITDPIQVSGSIHISPTLTDQRPQNNSISKQITPSPK
jgi:hypothetical protein